ncbi:ion transporter [Pelagibius litoralis]|uniref:Ion transporter n=1 Tax=Pelagibius litoralis TaxID=374515 RepID=A0A967EV68_9PROT|nr:ion transporter [Pelagibius litoralis]NIA68211.1 ion transporter [Pelagibius litoralis]
MSSSPGTPNSRSADPAQPSRLQRALESSKTQRAITILILINAVVLGLETSASVMAQVGDFLLLADQAIVAVFVIEILAKLWVYRTSFFKDPWNLFDFTVVAISLAPGSAAFSVLRALRVLRVLRLISVIPSMRKVVQALLQAIPGMGSVAALLGLIYYVFAVMATKLFGAAFPDWFGSIGASAYSLFQIMTLESWSMGIVRPVMTVFPYAWAFFVPFILVTTFAVLNLFIAIIVNAMQSQHDEERDEALDKITQQSHGDAMRLEDDLKAVHQEVREIRKLLERQSP